MGFLDKVKNLFTDEIEEEPIKSEVIQVEIPSPLKEEKNEEDIVSDNEIVTSEEKVSAPIFFDDDYFKELEQPKQEYRFNSIKEQPKKEEKKVFKPTPIISPVYGVLDKNYSKEDITTKQEKQIEKTNTIVTLDEVRKKAYGTLEDELENTLFGSTSILFNDEIQEEVEEDLFDELIDIEDDSIKHASKDSINIVEDSLSKTIDKPLDEGEHFDLIDSMYERV